MDFILLLVENQVGPLFQQRQKKKDQARPFTACRMYATWGCWFALRAWLHRRVKLCGQTQMDVQYNVDRLELSSLSD